MNSTPESEYEDWWDVSHEICQHDDPLEYCEHCTTDSEILDYQIPEE